MYLHSNLEVHSRTHRLIARFIAESKEMLTCRRPSIVRGWGQRVKSMVIITLNTFEDDISSLLSLPLFHAYIFLFISLPIGTPRNSEREYIGKKGEERNGQRACVHQVCILQSAIRGTLELVHASEEFPGLRGSQR